MSTSKVEFKIQDTLYTVLKNPPIASFAVGSITISRLSFVMQQSNAGHRKILVILALVAGVLTAPQGNLNDITIVKQEEVNNIGVGGYHFSYEQSDGQKREETAELKNEGTDDEALSVVGSFSFIAPDGHTYRVDYTADETGFHPTINLVAK
ncbi:hypothetical protein DMN91_000052 [Ooceraea biroi]|uniref:Flexible cuticle protein n=2 Tax=Ooceraea biroi TaxID=2015173 RepID=A0A3L8E237_OOCBI|nr:hypothetical protein DMN91_000052 [Ooceraea biroi]